MILSPAKTLDLTPIEAVDVSQPDCNPEHTKTIAHCMKQRTPAELAKLLSLSSNLAQTAAQYWKEYDEQTPNQQAKPCIYAFSGAAYQGLNIQDCDSAALSYMQMCLRIIDPLYGVLRPMDLIQPYRLEMAAKGVLRNDPKLKLADYWKPAVTQRLSQDLQQFSEPILLNLASDEYAAAVDASQLDCIKVIFQENGKVVAVHAKRARGLMVRYLSSIQATTLEQVQSFALEGYEYQSHLSDETTLVFNRQKQTPKRTQTSTKQAAKRTRKA